MPAEILTKKDKAKLITLIGEKCLQIGSFNLASGGTSNYLFDMKKGTLDPDTSEIITKAMLKIIYSEGYTYVGGMATGAIPIVAQIVLQSKHEKKPVYGFFVRKDTSDGRNPRIEGNIEKGAKVILIDDVTTKGGSVLFAVKVIRENGCKVDKVITIVDRLDEAKKNLKKEGIDLIALTDKNDFKDEIDRRLSKK